MKKTSEVLKEHPEYATLIRSVIRQLGDKTYIEDVNNHGAGNGFSGFTYYSDTVYFFRKHRKDIISLVKDLSEGLGEQTITMISNFNCLKDMKIGTDEIAESLYTNKGKLNDQIQNAMAWFALEEVCRWFED